MAGGSFRFKEFTINQHRSAMKLSSDAVLFGAWCNFEGDARVLDIGTGTGILSLMCAQRSGATVCALEPDEGSYEDARENFEASPWASRLELIKASLQDFAAAVATSTDLDSSCSGQYPKRFGRFDHIISNPPYFSSSLKCPDSARSAARHNHSLPFAELVEGAYGLLEKNGRLSVILPALEEANFMSCTSKYFNLSRRVEVFSKAGGPVKRLLLEFSLSEVEAAEHGSLVVADGQGGYSEEFAELTRDFYL